jgi:outer membrane lipoprotein-sorting protein
VTRRARLACAVAALSLLAGCPSVILGTIPELPPITEVQQAVRSFALRDAAVNTMRARLRVKVKPEEGRAVSTTVLVTLKRPGSLRVETLGPLDELEAVFVIRDGRYHALSMQERKVRRGPASAAAVEEATGLRLSPGEAEALLAGAFRVIDFAQGQIGADEAKKEVAVLLEVPGRHKQIIRADRDTLAIKRLEAYEGDEKRYTVEYDETSPVMGIPFAHRITISFEGRISSVDVKYREIEMNPPVADAEFSLEVPRGFTVEDR